MSENTMSENTALCSTCKFAFSGGLAPWDCDGGCSKEDELAGMEDDGRIDISAIGQEDGERCPLWAEFIQEMAHCNKHGVDHLAEDPCGACEAEELAAMDAEMESWQSGRAVAPCQHGQVGECDACDTAGDLAYDAARETWTPSYRD